VYVTPVFSWVFQKIPKVEEVMTVLLLNFIYHYYYYYESGENTIAKKKQSEEEENTEYFCVQNFEITLFWHNWRLWNFAFKLVVKLSVEWVMFF
jgi:hypothetical protein